MSDLYSRIARFFKIASYVLLQTIQRRIISTRRSWLFSPATQPDTWKVITNKTYLYPSRVFRPKIQDATSVPLVIMVHGGGFIMNNPSADDPLARLLADTCNCVVVNIDYRKSPIHIFPAAYEDVVESIASLLGDDGNDLPFDRNKVVLCGSSAGGNLILGAAQDPRLRGKLLGAVGIYPVVNTAASAEEQMAARPDPTVPDFIGPTWENVKELYARTNDTEVLKDPRLSPTYFKKRDDLPKRILMIGVEHDMLCHEAKIMAEKLADAPIEQGAEGKIGGNVTWRFVKGQTHAFDHFPKKTREDEAERVREKDKMYQDIAEWLNDVFSAV